MIESMFENKARVRYLGFVTVFLCAGQRHHSSKHQMLAQHELELEMSLNVSFNLIAH